MATRAAHRSYFWTRYANEPPEFEYSIANAWTRALLLTLSRPSGEWNDDDYYMLADDPQLSQFPNESVPIRTVSLAARALWKCIG